MSDYHDEEEFESLEEYQERESSEDEEIDGDWGDSYDDMESGDWSEQFDRRTIELEEVEDAEDFGDDEVDDYDLERIERNYFAQDEKRRRPKAAGGRTGGGEPDNPTLTPLERGDDALVDRFVEVKEQLRSLQRELRDLKPRVIEAIGEGEGSGDDPLARVKLAKRPKWKYSDEIARLEEMIREKKRAERETGVAVVAEETSYLVIRP
ncbi:MAG: hypothetical protein ACOC45_00640 [Alkalispirochaetaceae bacterium]